MSTDNSAEGKSLLTTWAQNFTNNTNKMFTEMRLKDWIRIVIVVGAYCLIRPHLMKLGEKAQMRAHEKEAEKTRAAFEASEQKSKIEIPGVDEDDEEADKEEKPGDWGRNARVRQRKFVRDAMEKEEQKLQQQQEDEEDKDIQEFLVD